MRHIQFGITLRSRSGRSIYREPSRLRASNVEEFLPREGVPHVVADSARRAGFHVEAVTAAGVTMSAEPDHAREVFEIGFKIGKVPMVGEFDRLVATPLGELARHPFGDDVERVFVCRQSFELGNAFPSARAPELAYRHCDLPHDIISLGHLSGLRERGLTGRGVRVAMVDTGLYRHPYFAAQGVGFEVVPGVDELDPARDERGHGTGMAAVLLATAPEVLLTMYKACSDHYGAALPAFQRAATSGAQVINCSWGTIGAERQLHLEVACAVRQGVTVVFSAGNGACDRPEAVFQTVAHPDVISVGGCHPLGNGEFEVANLSSSYESAIFAGRSVPDVCGPCGMRPFGQLILMPTEPGCIYDRNNGRRDGTAPDDGWFVSSGTSAAAAYVSGVVAILLQARPGLRGAELRSALFASCRAISTGESYMRVRAVPERPNRAAGHGITTGDLVLSYLDAAQPLRGVGTERHENA